MSGYAYFYSSLDDTKETTAIKRKKIRAYALLNDFEVEQYFIEKAEQQFKPFNQRLKGKKLLNSLGRKNILIADKLSDIFYSAQETLKTLQLFKKYNIDLHIIEIGGRLFTENKNDLLWMFVKRFADYEIHHTREKKITTEKNTYRRRGKVPFGFSIQGKKLIKNDEEQLIIRDMGKMQKNGQGYLAISKKILEKYNVMFSHMGVKKILQRNSKILEDKG